MSKPFTPKVVTANDLHRGDVIYQTQMGWSRVLSAAEVLTDEAIADLRLIDAVQQSAHVVGVYLADVVIRNGVPEPQHFREAFRSRGPSNYAHGKQELASDV